ncbi:hypothetical protein C8R43DRAFT_1102685 [Mycena crocata]|nr:hypothetical protein C8R43DRAFT_1102685 [Mycena crocata]
MHLIMSSPTGYIGWVAAVYVAYFVYRLVLHPRFFSPERNVPASPLGNPLLGVDYLANLTHENGIMYSHRPSCDGLLAGYGLLTVTGNEHKQLRKAMNPAFSIQHLMAHFPPSTSSASPHSDTAQTLHNPHNELAIAFEKLEGLMSAPVIAGLIALMSIPGAAQLTASDWMYRPLDCRQAALPLRVRQPRRIDVSHPRYCEGDAAREDGGSVSLAGGYEYEEGLPLLGVYTRRIGLGLTHSYHQHTSPINDGKRIGLGTRR